MLAPAGDQRRPVLVEDPEMADQGLQANRQLAPTFSERSKITASRPARRKLAAAPSPAAPAPQTTTFPMRRS